MWLCIVTIQPAEPQAVWGPHPGPPPKSEGAFYEDWSWTSVYLLTNHAQISCIIAISFSLGEGPGIRPYVLIGGFYVYPLNSYYVFIKAES